jgi:DNA-binding FrmR family transcriptional regulator
MSLEPVGRTFVETITPYGYVSMMNASTKRACRARLGRIEGQIRGITRMVEDDRYCIDVITQIQAAKAALRRVEEEVLQDHVSHCVAAAIESGDTREQRKKVAELMQVLGRRSA